MTSALRPFRMVPLLAALTAPIAAFDAELIRTKGILNGTLKYELNGDPNELFWLILSLNEGPTPLSLLDPTDPRILDVGLDLFVLNPALTPIGFLNGSGTASISISLGTGPALQCLPLYAQFVTATLPLDFVQISNQTGVVLSEAGESCNTLGDNVVARQGHSLSPLADGRALVVGGDEPDSGGNLTPLDSLEIFNPTNQAFESAGTLQHARSTHTATVLADGRILILGGYDETETVRNTGEIFDPDTGTVTPIAPMSEPRTQHTTTLLSDGRVFVAGGAGLFDVDDVLSSLATATDTTEVYDPTTNSWSSGPDLDKPTIGHAASLLQDGQVLISGGVDVSIVFGLPIPSLPATCYRYDPGSNSFVATADLPEARTYHGQTVLNSGNALVVGGASGDLVLLQFNTLATTYLYDPVANSWSQASDLNNARAYPNLIRDGISTYILGGLSTVDISTGSGDPEVVIERTGQTAGNFTILGSMILPREVGRSVLVEGGDRVLTVGTGDNGVSAVDATAELFVP